MYERFIKRWLDAAGALAGLLILWPLFLLIAAGIRLDGRGPVFFFQQRMGKDNQLFWIIKFRTMPVGLSEDVPTERFDQEDCLSFFQMFLRTSSLDELPQLVNILFGDMSFIGPRPALWNQEDLITQRTANASYRLRPGLSGLAQISGRDRLDSEQKAQLDGMYAGHLSFRLDLKILLGTLWPVLIQKDVKNSRSRKKLEYETGSSRVL